jgi:hypothetical protein
MLETIYKDLATQLGPIGALLLGSGWLVSFGLFRACFFLYSELSKERKKNEALQTRLWGIIDKFNQTIRAMNQTIRQYQERDKLSEAVKTALAEYGSKLKP